jgi:hypothetical protein
VALALGVLVLNQHLQELLIQVAAAAAQFYTKMAQAVALA